MDLKYFLERNAISEEKIMTEFYIFILCSYLKKACIYLSEDNCRKLFLSNYRKAINEDIFFYNFANSVAGCKLAGSEIDWFKKCIMANIRKSPVRNKFDNHVKVELYSKQDRQCAICGKEIALESSHLDHIIPWELVGDELLDNYQLLCKNCNLHKSNGLNFQLFSLMNI